MLLDNELTENAQVRRKITPGGRTCRPVPITLENAEKEGEQPKLIGSESTRAGERGRVKESKNKLLAKEGSLGLQLTITCPFFL